MSTPIQKILSLGLLVLIALSAIFIVVLYVKEVPIETSELVRDMNETGGEMSPIVSLNLNWAYILVIANAIAALAFPALSFVESMKENPKSAIKAFIIIGVFAIILGIAYSTSSGDMNSIAPSGTVNTTEGELKWSGTGLCVTAVLLVINVLSIIYLEVAKKLR